MLSEFSIENYKAFARFQQIKLRPLTLFFGWNSAGKSALVRFLPLLAESVAIDGPPIWLSGQVGRRATWPELVCKSSQRDTLRFSLTWQRPHSLFADFEVQGDLEGRWQETSKLEVKVNESDEGSIKYLRLDQSDDQNRSWTGLLPAASSEPKSNLYELRQRLAEFPSDIQWISGVRVRPSRQVTYGGGAPAQLQSDGSDALDHLIAAQLRSGVDPLLTMTSEFFEELGHVLELENPSAGSWRLMLRAIGGLTGINLCDTGEGYAQVIPVLVALARSRLGGPKILCLEQPELHLHTRAQYQLSKTLVKYASQADGHRILVETHSEVLLVGLQLAIARGEISPEMVQIYWVEGRPDGTSEAIPVELNKNGQPNVSVLTSAFGEVTSLGQQLVQSQLGNLQR